MTNEPPDRPSEAEPAPPGEPQAVPTEAPADIPDAGGTAVPPPRVRLARSRTNRVIAGVAGGLGEYFEVDPTLVRVAIIALTIISGGLFALAYLAAIIIMPRGAEEPSPIAGGSGAVRTDASNAVAIVFGLILIAVGVTALVEVTDLPGLPWDAVLAALLVLVGLAVLFESRHGVNGGLVTAGVVLTAVLAVTTAVPGTRWDSGFGERSVHPTTIAALHGDYDHAFGSMVVDLRDVPFPDGETRINIGITFGDLSVHVPSDVAVRVSGRTVFGSSSILGRQHNGVTANIEEESVDYDAAARRLEIDLSNTFGSATVRQ